MIGRGQIPFVPGMIYVGNDGSRGIKREQKYENK